VKASQAAPILGGGGALGRAQRRSRSSDCEGARGRGGSRGEVVMPTMEIRVCVCDETMEKDGGEGEAKGP